MPNLKKRAGEKLDSAIAEIETCEITEGSQDLTARGAKNNAPIRTIKRKITNEEENLSRNQKRYRQGIMPALHKVLHDAIIKALDGEKSGRFVMAEFAPSVGISRGGGYRILKALEENGYIRIIPNNRRNQGTEIEILK